MVETEVPVVKRQLDFAAAVLLPEHSRPEVLPVEHHPEVSPKSLTKIEAETGSKSPAVTSQVMKPRTPTPRHHQVESKLPMSGRLELNNSTLKKHKQCKCRNSLCLKKYCECFASGSYCKGCDCTNCHNSVEHEAERQSVIEAILSRDPYAFRPKIENSPHKKGCNCKKSGCLKKYCDCFQANILCSENCKCVDCKNFEGSGERRAVVQGDQTNSAAYIQQATNAAITVAIGSAGSGPSKTQKRKKLQLIFEEGSGSLSSDPISQFQKDVTDMRPMRLRSTYRSPLADILQPEYVKELCSLLVVISAKEKDRKVHNEKVKDQIGSSAALESNDIETQNEPLGFSSNKLDRVQSSACNSKGGENRDSRELSPGTLGLMCEEQDTTFLRADSSTGIWGCSAVPSKESSLMHNVSREYAVQEKLVLTRFCSFLNRIVTCGSIKEMHSPLTKNGAGR